MRSPEISASASRKLAELTEPLLSMSEERGLEFIQALRLKRTRPKALLKAGRKPRGSSSGKTKEDSSVEGTEPQAEASQEQDAQ